MKSLIRCLVVLNVIVTGSVCCLAQVAPAKQGEPHTKGGVTTLYALDPLAQSFCFRDGDFGLTFQQHQLRNRCSDINFNSYHADHFAVGIEGGRIGVLVDLGTTDDLRKKYGYDETVTMGQGFASLHFENGKVMILKDRRAGAMQELQGSTQLFAAPTAGYKAPVKIGHLYLARIIDEGERGSQVLVKLLVIAHAKGESVTFRWQSL